MMLDDTFDFISRGRSIYIDRTRIDMCHGEELLIWILQLRSQKRSVDHNETGGSKGNLAHIVVSLRHAAEDLVGSYKDSLEFVKLSLFREVGGRDLDEISNIVLGRGAAALVCLLRHCNTAADKLYFERIPKSVGYHVRSEGGSRNDDALFELGRETNTESVSGSIPRSIDRSINSHLNKGDCRHLVESLL